MARCREEARVGAVFPGIFKGCAGVADVKENKVVKYLDPVRKRRSGSGKMKSIVTNYCL
jgi:hypothetical protein